MEKRQNQDEDRLPKIARLIDIETAILSYQTSLKNELNDCITKAELTSVLRDLYTINNPVSRRTIFVIAAAFGLDIDQIKNSSP